MKVLTAEKVEDGWHIEVTRSSQARSLEDVKKFIRQESLILRLQYCSKNARGEIIKVFAD